MKKVVFLIIVSLLLIGLLLTGCAGEGGGGGGGDGSTDTRPSITFAVAGAMTDVTGENQWWGAELARDEINAGAGVNVGGMYHKVALVQVDTNEVSGTPEEGAYALQAVIDDVDFVLGGSVTENVVVYREVTMNAKKIFMNCGAAAQSLQYSVVKDYDTYKYWFMTNPINSEFIGTSLFKLTAGIGTVLKSTLVSYGDAVAEDYRVPENGKLRVAILMENAAWCTAGLVPGSQVCLPQYGFDLVGTWLVSPTATDISAELTQIESNKPHIIFDAYSGPVGVVYFKQKAELGIPAMTIGINGPGHEKSHWANTEGKCNGEIMLDTWAEGLQNTAKTTAFFNAFMAKTGDYPLYTAATYDAIYQLKVAIEAVSAANGWKKIADVVTPAHIDTLIQYLETSSHVGTAGKTAYYPMPNIDLGGGIYALSEEQVRSLYDLDSYGWTYDLSQWRVSPTTIGGGCIRASGHIAHDLVYGPGYATGIGSQWQDGKKVGVWPVDLGDDYDAALTDQYGCWNFEYPGTVDVVIPIEGFLAS